MAIRVAKGTVSFSSSIHLGTSWSARFEMPVTCPPECARLSTRPACRVGDREHHHRNPASGGHHRARRDAAAGDDQVNAEPRHLVGVLCKAFGVALGVAPLDDQVAALGEAEPDRNATSARSSSGLLVAV